ncbi:PAS domain S-box protein [Acidiluteibacter ferrifornacis]|uniref:Sensory/regulatory protein RpfC n=1 Tax=Acidiluteibacter ferrifornacis TaxID=2692424 RepID=A0A6N9NPZ6_9FLAO|nr:PAS domain S-box protein [Acidiluteibacter ferrifornacis]NBG67360.1 PAS domain S-box protein [Acidiluteibacter ferrifornacis]
MDNEVDILKRRIEREKRARRQAEKILEDKSLELHFANENLRKINSELEDRVAQRTEELKETESRFRLLVETASDIIYRTDNNGYFTYANPTALLKIGYSLEEIKQIRFSALVDAEYTQEIQAFYLEQSIRKEVTSYKEFPVINKKGDTIWLGQNVNFIYDDSGELVQVNAVARDITEIKLSETRLKNLIATLQSGVLLEDENRKMVLVNQTFCNLFAIPAPPDSLIGLDCSSSAEESKVSFIDEEGFVNRINEILESKEKVLNDELLLKDGRIFERDYIPIYVENRYSGHLWNYRDVTIQRNQVNAIKRSEEKYRSIIENMNLGLLEVDKNEKILYANQSFCKMSGFELDEILNSTASKLFVRGENAEVLIEKNSMRTKGVSDAYEIATKNKRGEAKWWLVSGAPLFDQLGKPTGSVGIHLDITSQKEIERELVEAKYQAEESSKVKEVFLANMSHEIRTPMNGIIGMARQLNKTKLDEKQQFHLDVIRSAADNLMIILNDILDLSKIEAGKLSIENVSFNLGDSLKKACDVMQPKAEEKGLTLTTHTDSKIAPTLFGDPFRLNQVLFNLIGNSIKFTQKGSVTISSELIKNQGNAQLIQISVTDTGVGIDKQYLETIFDKFTQEDRSTARKYGGTGLGMNISKQLVDLMGGDIAIESKKGEGTKVIITLPFLLSDQDISEESSFSNDQYNCEELKGKSLLIAEDNELNRLVIETTLAQYELNLHFATNGKEAIDVLQEKPIDLILMDIQMPVMDGIEATQYIRNQLKIDIPIIALTANVLKGDTESYIASGMNDTVRKPFEEREILETLMQWLGKSTLPKADNKEPVLTHKALYTLEKLSTISRGDQIFISKMVAIFIQQTSSAIEEMKEAEATNDYDRIRKLAHKLKPSLDNLQINSLKETVRKLEYIGEEYDIEELPQLNQQFCDVLDKVVKDLQKNYA